MKGIKSYLKALTDIIYPRSCVACNSALLRNEDHLCVSCLVDLPLNPQIHQLKNEITDVFAGRLPLVTANTLLYFQKNGITQHLIHALKYQDNEQVGEYLGELLGLELAKLKMKKVDVIIPVPLHPDKKKQRGYNQCDSIARGLCKHLDAAVDSTSIARIKSNTSQTKLNRAQRWENVKNIFELVDEFALANKHVLLVDDTLTTGATLESCGSALLGVEGLSLSIATLAYAK